MNPVRAHAILTDTQRGNKRMYRSVVESLAPGIGRRVPVIMEMPKLERHAAFAQLLAQPMAEDLGFNVLSQWLVQEHAPMLCDWLDALGIGHDEKGCAKSFPDCPPAEKIRAAADALLAKYEPELVTVYLTAFNEIDEVGWEPLAKLLAEDARLQLAAADPPEGVAKGTGEGSPET